MLSVSTTLNTNCIVKCRYATCRSHFIEDRGTLACLSVTTDLPIFYGNLHYFYAHKMFFTLFTAVNKQMW
jgi:hypothetical protein